MTRECHKCHETKMSTYYKDKKVWCYDCYHEVFPEPEWRPYDDTKNSKKKNG